MNIAVTKTQQWLDQIIIGLNFCPFAKKEFVNNTIHYHVSTAMKVNEALELLALQFEKLIKNVEIETTLVIFDGGFRTFERYLDLVDFANDLLIELGYEGTFQLASFHPEYYFEGEDYDDAANYTNRSPLPIIHIIREESMAKVLSVYKEPETIPENNIALAQQKGADYFKQVLQKIHEADC